MDIFERLFGISPDGGTGSLESIYVIVVLIAVAVVVVRRHIAALFRGIVEAARTKRG